MDGNVFIAPGSFDRSLCVIAAKWILIGFSCWFFNHLALGARVRACLDGHSDVYYLFKCFLGLNQPKTLYY